MQNLILGAVGIVIMIVSAFQLKKLLYMKKRGVTVLAEVTEVEEIKRGRRQQVDGYAHKMRYEAEGKTIEAVDKAGYNQPLKVGSKELIVYDPRQPDYFEYEGDIKKNITLFTVMLCVTVIFSAYWLCAGITHI